MLNKYFRQFELSPIFIYISKVFQGFVYHDHLIVTQYLGRTLELSVEAGVATGAASRRVFLAGVETSFHAALVFVLVDCSRTNLGWAVCQEGYFRNVF